MQTTKGNKDCPTAGNVGSERKPYLDGVRGVAACVVFFNHLSLSLTGGSWIFNGNSSVCIFFVLSAFVLSDLAQRSPLSFPALALRRYLRLIVPMIATSTLAWALLAAGLYRNQEASALLNSSWLGNWYKFAPSFHAMIAETLYGVFVTGQSGYNCNLWTMRPELIGSLYVFVINATARPRRLRALCYLALAVFYSDDYVMLFSAGALLHDYHAELAVIINRTWLKACLFILSLFLCVAPMKYVQVVAPMSEIQWHMIAAVLLVVSVLRWDFLQGLLGNAFGRLLGRISFVLYLIHVPIICSLTAWIVISLPAPFAIPIAAATTLVVVFAASIAIYRWVDGIPTQWSRAAGYAFDARFSGRRTPATASPS
jgi:peptidoglycan/LPS O-acetylase OafA/YrhL